MKWTHCTWFRSNQELGIFNEVPDYPGIGGQLETVQQTCIVYMVMLMISKSIIMLENTTHESEEMSFDLHVATWVDLKQKTELKK